MDLVRVLIGVAIALFLAACSAPEAAVDLEPGESGRVVQVIDGDQLVLDGGLKVRLAGVEAPRLGRNGAPGWPKSAESRAELERLVMGRTVHLFYDGLHRDRSGQTAIAFVSVEDETGRQSAVQDAMLNAGMVRVHTWADNRAKAAAFLALEARARSAKAGIWAEPFYAVRTADALVDDIGHFEVIEGVVRRVQRNGDRVFLNFGADYRSDFTVTIAGESLGAWADNGAGLASLAGQRVRVRGRIEDLNGPLVTLTCPEQIEVLKAAAVDLAPDPPSPA
jgi:micrococcal nuclease